MGIKKTRQQHGFTIIELSLFFAVSGLLLVTMLTGIGLAVQRQRFTDSVNGTQSFLQQQYNETQITINNRSNDPCSSVQKGTSNCLVIGKIIDLKNGTGDESVINTYPVIINQQAADDAMKKDTPPTDLDLLNDPTGTLNSNTRALKDAGNDQQYIVPWGAKLDTIRDSGGDSDIRYILILRSPINGLISTYKLTDTADLFTGIHPDEETIGRRIDDFGGDISSRSVKSCLKSADLMSMKALLKITPGSTQDSITTQVDTSEKDAWCL